MWKKDETAAPGSPTQAPAGEAPRRTPARDTSGSTELATIGRSITIHGEVTGDEDLLIQGRVDGSVELKQQSVTVGQDGRVTAAITGRIIVVEGEVQGDLQAQEQVVLRATARVQGDITAPRVVLEDGAAFTGGMDMGDPLGKGSPASGNAPAPSKGSTAGPSSTASAPGISAGSTSGSDAKQAKDKADDSGKADG